jgi:hypothetical protein
MRIPLPYSPLAKKLQDMQIQRDYLFLLRDHHLLWSKQADDPNIMGMHMEIIDLIKQLEGRYEAIRVALQS